jgi:hypothetical protein
MKNILTVTSIIESAAAVILLLFPSLFTSLLFGVPLDTPVAVIVARVAGATLFSLAVACWFVRNEGNEAIAKGVVIAMLFYNIFTTLIVIYAAFGLSLLGIGLWPVVLIHTSMSFWCLSTLFKKAL